MHSLKGTYIKLREPEDDYYPVKMVISQKKARVFFMDSKEVQKRWFKAMCKSAGCANVFDYYEFTKEIAAGN